MAIEIPARIAFLKKIHPFYGLEDDDYERIANELDEMQVPKDGVVYEQGGKADSFYLIYGGSVRIVRRHNNKEIQLAILVKNDYFGEMALVEHRLHSGTVTAMADTSLLVLSRKDFEKLYKTDPQLKLNLEVAIKSRQLARRVNFKWLRDDEVIYFLARKHRLVLYQKLILPIVALSVPAFFFYAWYAIVGFTIVGIAAWLSLIAVVVWGFWLIIDWGNDYYIVTNQRVVWLEKVVGIYDSRMESPIHTVLSVGVEANQFGRLLDYGNVIVRTFVGRIVFSNVDHPEQAARMIEEYWGRTREAAVGIEKEAMKNALRKRLGIPIPPQPKPFGSVQEKPPAPKTKPPWWIAMLGLDALKLRLEEGDSIIYRKHWIALIIQAWMPIAGIFAALTLFLNRLWRLAFDPNAVFISFAGGINIDTWALVFSMGMVPFIGWLIYEIADWSNDKFQVTAEQIIDLDKKPFGTETRNAAQLDSILGTEYKRIGILGNLFNYGTVYITVGGSKFAFEDVMDPPAVQSDIDRRRMARSAKKKEAEVATERERMAEWLATYHTSSDDFRREMDKRNQKSE
ncbi:MAG TPA: cyclic nucleotide-binding domain-containing protein [Anaerolineales bacterium]|nr:cyclic nucleotide-binding domain-containing protein [Anaerolineales bacterium]